MFGLLIANEGKMNMQTATANNTVVSSVMMVTPRTVVPSQTLADMVNRVMLHHAVSFVPVVDGPVALGYIDTNILRKIDRENWASTQVGDVFVARDSSNCVSPDTEAVQLLQRIVPGGPRKFLVVDGETLLGVVTLADLVECLGEWFESVLSERPAPPAKARH